MNKLPGTISKIQQSGAILLVDINVDGHLFSALMIESLKQPDWLKIGNAIELVFKETEVSLAKNLSGLISTRNRMDCIITKIERGELLSKIDLKFQRFSISSAITTRSVEALDLKVGDKVEALIKANEVSLMKS